MTCEPTQTPDQIDIPALRQKYSQEREKRLRSERQQQYLPTVDDFADQYGLDPHAASPFALDKMRYKWRQWVVFDCNWKVVLEA